MKPTTVRDAPEGKCGRKPCLVRMAWLMRFGLSAQRWERKDHGLSDSLMCQLSFARTDEVRRILLGIGVACPTLDGRATARVKRREPRGLDTFSDRRMAYKVAELTRRMTGDRVRVSGSNRYLVQRYTGSRWVRA